MEYHTFVSFPIVSTFILFVIMALRIWKKSKITISSHQNLPPGPWKLPIIGSMHHLLGDMPHRRLSDLAQKYGPVMHLQLGEVTNIIISSPETAKQVMKTHDINFAQRPFMVAANILFDNNRDIAFAPYGDYWRQMRKLCTLELLSAKRVGSFRFIREEELSKLIDGIYHKAGSPINLTSMFRSLNYSIISRSACNVRNGEDIFVPMVNRITEALGGFSLADLYPSMKWLHHIIGARRTAERIHQEVEKVMEDVINQHRKKNSVNKTGLDNEEDLVDVLLELQKEGDLQIPLSTNNIKAIILDLFCGGTETSTTTLEWAMSELMRNPKTMEKAQAEVRRVFGENGNVEETRLDELNYIKSVIKETLRLHPPLALLLPRECGEKCEINGHDIPAKSRVIVNAWAIGRDTNYWVEAEKFIPERFLDGSIDYKGTNFEYVPFGAGRRMCPGLLFGTVNVEYTLSQLLYHFDWKLPNAMKSENLDMTELFSIVVQRKNDLMLIPISHVPLCN